MEGRMRKPQTSILPSLSGHTSSSGSIPFQLIKCRKSELRTIILILGASTGKISWTEEPGGLELMGSHSQTRLSTHIHILIIASHGTHWASLVAQLVKDLPAVQETGVWSLGWEDSLENEMATHSSILAWKISWTEEPGGPQAIGLQRVGQDWSDWARTHREIAGRLRCGDCDWLDAGPKL